MTFASLTSVSKHRNGLQYATGCYSWSLSHLLGKSSVENVYLRFIHSTAKPSDFMEICFHCVADLFWQILCIPLPPPPK